MHLNEFQGEHAYQVLAELPASSNILSQYPSGRAAAALAAEVCERLGCADARAFLTAGSDDALRFVLDAAALKQAPGIPAVVGGEPLYPDFARAARARGLPWHPVQFGCGTAETVRETLLGQAIQAARRRCGVPPVVYLCTPNNPNGDMWSAAAVGRLATAFPDSCLLVDEAYIEFTNVCSAEYTTGEFWDTQPDACAAARRLLYGQSVWRLVTGHSNVIVTRTFSKAFGLAGLRVGYILCGPRSPYAMLLENVISTKAVTTGAMTVVRAVLARLPEYARAAAEAATCRAHVAQFLRDGGVRVLGDGGNFVLWYAGDVQRTVRVLLDHNIEVRPRDRLPGLTGCVRATIGTAGVAAAFCQAVGSAGLLADWREAGAAAPQQWYTPKETIAELRRIFCVARECLAAARLVWWLEAGTLIGALRHGGPLPWDDDFDLGYDATKAHVKNVEDALAQRGLTLQRNRTGAYWQIGTQKPGEKISDVHVDLFPFYRVRGKDGDEYVNADPRFAVEAPDSPHAHCNTRYRLAAGAPFAIKYVLFDGELTPVPENAEAALDRALGPRWRTHAVVRGQGSTAPIVAKFELTDFAPA